MGCSVWVAVIIESYICSAESRRDSWRAKYLTKTGFHWPS